jgi:fructose 1,6-bisphosphate aldolase/phosphatase
MTTLSVIKADIGGFVGHSCVHPELMAIARKELEKAKSKGAIIDFHVTHCGDDLELIMTHNRGENNEIIHKLAWDTFLKATEKAKEMKLYGAGQDLLSDAFSGNVKGMGPGVAELTFEERKSEPFIIFMADKTDPGAFNLPMYKIFADPFNTAGLVIDPGLNQGFTFKLHDVKTDKIYSFTCPEDLYDMLSLLGARSRYCVEKIFRRDGLPAAAVSTQKLNMIAGKYVGKDDPVAIVRCHSGLPALGEVLEAFAQTYLVAGWMRGSHVGPVMPVSVEDAACTRFDGPTRMVALGFQIANGKLIGPQDLFKDKAFDRARWEALKIADFMRKHGPFEPHRLPPDEMEYTSLPQVLEKVEKKAKEKKK